MTAELTPDPILFRPEDIAPYFSYTLLECTSPDPEAAFQTLCDLVREAAVGQRSGQTVLIVGQLGDGVEAPEMAALLEETGMGGVFGFVRERRRPPGWLVEPIVTDTTHELAIAAWRGGFAALHADDIVTDFALRKWLKRAPYRVIPQAALAGLFPGDVRMAWLSGTHRPRTTKADSIAKGGLRLQDASKPLEDASYAMKAAATDFDPGDDSAQLRGAVTAGAARSRVSWAQRPTLLRSMLALVEVFERLDKALVSEQPPDPVLPWLAVPETDLTAVRGAFDIGVATTMERPAEQWTQDDLDRMELLRGTLMDVTGSDDSADFVVEVGCGGALAGELKVKVVQHASGYGLDVRLHRAPSRESVVSEVRAAIGEGDLLTVHFATGHAFTGHQIYRQNLARAPFEQHAFEDFEGYVVHQEKPSVLGDQAIHEMTGVDGDGSLFAWVVDHFGAGELICDDGAGEIADFLHIANDGTLTVIHVKAADNSSPNRQTSLTRYEQLVSQAEKNIRALDSEGLIVRLSAPRIERPACWSDGTKHCDRTPFLDALRTRTARDRTRVMIIQPHLLKSAYDRARAAIAADNPTPESRRLHLLDDLLLTTQANMIGRCDEFVVIGEDDT